MRKTALTILFFGLVKIFSQDGAPVIIIPKIDIKIEDNRNVDAQMKINETKSPLMENIDIPRPDISEKIKIDLEKTLPEIIKEPGKQKPVDALITFGYGLNNYLFADFSLFVKQINPGISIHYLRESKETLWFNRPDIKNPVSKDDLQAQMIFNLKNFSINADTGYYSNSYKLQEKSIYDSNISRMINIDLGPAIKFNNNNDLTINLFNTFIIKDLNGEINNDLIKRSAFGYILQSDIIYSQVFGSNHFFSTHAGYDFNYLYDLISGKKNYLSSGYKDYFFNSIKAGLGYSTTLKDSFSIKGSFDFNGLFRDKKFFWYLLPMCNFGYNFKEYFYTYIEGGGKLEEKPEKFWLKSYDYAVYPIALTPGYHWYARSGIAGSYPGWIRANTDFDFAYNLNSFNWHKEDSKEHLYTLIKHTYMELNLYAGLSFTVKDYFELDANWTHRFYDRIFLSPRDELYIKIKWGAPKIGLFFYTDFTAKFLRLDTDYNNMPNIYLLNAGVDWNWQERIGLGAKFANILYFSDYILFPGYNEPGFEFLIYLKIGF